MVAQSSYFERTPDGDRAFTFEATKETFGAGALAEVGFHARALGLSRVGLFTDPRVALLEPAAIAEKALRDAGIQVAVLLYPLVLVGAFELLSRVELLWNSNWAAGAITGGLAFIAGLVGGLQFPLATRLQSRRGGAVRSAGGLYGADLLGSCLGALVVASVLIPVFGVQGTAVLVAALGAAGLVVLLTRPRCAPSIPRTSPDTAHREQGFSTGHPQ